MRKSFGELFSESVEEFASKFGMIFKTFLFLYLLPLIVFGIIIILLMVVSSPSISGNVVGDFAMSGFSVFDSASDLPFSVGLVIALIILLFVLYVVLNVLINVSYIRIAFLEGKETFEETFEFARKYFWKYFGFGIVTGIFLIGLFILLIVPGIIFGVYWVFAYLILMHENTSILGSLKRSKEIVKGNWWRVFGFMILIGIVAAVVSLLSNFLLILGFFVPMLVLTPFITIFMKNFYLSLKN